MGAPWIEPVPFKLPGPFARQTKALVAAKCGPKYPIASVDVVATGTCDACAARSEALRGAARRGLQPSAHSARRGPLSCPQARG